MVVWCFSTKRERKKSDSELDFDIEAVRHTFIIELKEEFTVCGGTVVKGSDMQTESPGSDLPISASHLSLFGTTAEWPKTT